MLPRVGRPNDYQTFAARQPLSTHFKVVSCEDAGCVPWRDGWSYDLALLDASLLNEIKRSGKRYREVSIGLTHYLFFEKGQSCFDRHVVPIDRPAFFFVGMGDKRLFQVRNAKRYGPDDWRDIMQAELITIKELRERG